MSLTRLGLAGLAAALALPASAQDHSDFEEGSEAAGR